ncbi:MAG TPA: molybdenum cofactor guanylyltransferase [Candidatus Bathyarchaeia archaeon]|nr:molybdenum cofactor guanylyltransferase [Candidatus Bathyarchaeia archaeon]
MKRAVIVLAGGFSRRFGQDKCVKDLAGKPLVVHVLDRVASVADERVIVVGSEAQRNAFLGLSGLKARVVVDKYGDHSPLIGALTGFEAVQAECALLLPCDAAFVSSGIAALLLDLCVGRSAVIPRWPDGRVEPIQAAYNVELAADAAKTALNDGKRDMLAMIAHLRQIRYVSTMVLQQYDEGLKTFFNINTVEDWKRAESMLKKTQ